ncbi:MAG: TolC family protein [Lachnospiraceae bacterium]|nr:TolC family protein [Lachnospiraceae bacterium]
MKRKVKRILQSITALLLAAALLAADFLPAGNGYGAFSTEPETVYAGTAKPLSLSLAKSLAVAYDDKLEAIDLSIDAKKVAIKSAIRSLKEKKRSMSTFRWSPLLSFKFPTKPKEDEDLDFQFKPTKMYYELKVLYHKRDDQIVAVYEKVSTTYTDIVENMNQVAILEERIKNNTDVVSKLDKKVRLGTAKEADLEKAQSNLDKLKSDQTKLEGKIMKGKKKLGDMMGIEITDEYSFEDPFVTMNLNRDALDGLKRYTVDHDHACFEARKANEVQSISLRVNYSLIKSKDRYKKYVGEISGYIQQAMDGQKIDKRAFKKDYDRYLKDVDSKWQGKKRILFIKIPREWFKGQIDGIRYVENEPYILYNDALDYVSTQKEYANTCKDTEDMVEDTYDNYIEYRQAYLQARDARQKLAEKLAKDEVLCLMGELEQTEYDGEVGEYESAQDNVNSTFATYTECLYNFERLTCGGLSQYFTGGSVDAGDAAKNAAQGLVPIFAEGPRYSIKYMVDDEAFFLYVDVPDNYEPHITHFALICDKIQIGQKTDVKDGLKHLTLAKNEIEKCIVRLYNGDEVVGDCEIDPTVSSGPLNLGVGFEEDTTEWVTIGTYELEDLMSTDMTRITLKPDGTQELYYYNVLTGDNGKYVFTDELMKVEDPFDYVAISDTDLTNLKIRFFDAGEEPVYDAILETSKQELKVEKPFYDLRSEALAKKVEEEKAAQTAEAVAAKQAAAEEAAKTARDAAKVNDNIRNELLSASMKKLLNDKMDILVESVLNRMYRDNPYTKQYLNFFCTRKKDRDYGMINYLEIYVHDLTCFGQDRGEYWIPQMHYQVGPIEWLTKMFFRRALVDRKLYGYEERVWAIHSYWHVDDIYLTLLSVLSTKASGVEKVLKEAYREAFKDDIQVAVETGFARYIKTHEDVTTISSEGIKEIVDYSVEEMGGAQGSNMPYLNEQIESKIYEYYWSELQKMSAEEAKENYGRGWLNGHIRCFSGYVNEDFDSSWLSIRDSRKPKFEGGWNGADS